MCHDVIDALAVTSNQASKNTKITAAVEIVQCPLRNLFFDSGVFKV